MKGLWQAALGQEVIALPTTELLPTLPLSGAPLRLRRVDHLGGGVNDPCGWPGLNGGILLSSGTCRGRRGGRNVRLRIARSSADGLFHRSAEAVSQRSNFLTRRRVHLASPMRHVKWQIVPRGSDQYWLVPQDLGQARLVENIGIASCTHFGRARFTSPLTTRRRGTATAARKPATRSHGRPQSVTISCPAETSWRTSAIATSRSAIWRSTAPSGVRKRNVTRTTGSAMEEPIVRAYEAPWVR